MIRLQDLTPDVYYRKSRDFQFIGRLYDVVLNSVKTNADLINILPVSSLQQDQKLTELLLLTLGFQSKHKYNLVQEKALCSAFAYLLRNKGTKEAIETACAMLLAAEGISDRFEVMVNTATCSIEIKIPDSLSDVNLLKDLLTYLLPAGMTCDIYRTALTGSTTYTELTPSVIHYAANSSNDNMIEKAKIVNGDSTATAGFLGDVADKAGYFTNAMVTDPTQAPAQNSIQEEI